MSDLAKVRRRAFKRMLISGILFAVCVVLFGIGTLMPGLIDTVYTPLSRKMLYLLGLPVSILPFSFGEFLFIIAVGIFLVTLTMRIVRAITTEAGMHHLLAFAGKFLLTLGVLAILFTVLWGLNYTASPLEDKLNLNVRDRSGAALEATAIWLRDMANDTSGGADRVGGIVVANGFFGLRDSAAEGFESLAEQSPVFAGSVRLPKRVTFWPLLSYTGVSGIFIPLTAEANVNPDGPDCTLPFTMSHELAHSLGFAQEDDANFVAFLACERSGNGNYNYSGALTAFVYVYNKVAEENPELQTQLYEGLEADVKADLNNLSAHYKKYEGPAQTVGQAVNDTYLKTIGGQSDGVKSYGRVVDLLVAEYVKRYGEPGTV